MANRTTTSSRVVWAFALSSLIVICVTASRLEGSGKPLAEVPLFLTFGTADTDGLRSDGFVASGYDADYANGVENVQAILYPAGNLGFSTQSDERKPAVRSVCVDFGTQSVPFAPRQCVNIAQPMHEYTSDATLIQNLSYGQSVAKLTRFAWIDPSSNTIYRLGYGTDMDGDGNLDSPPARATCIAPLNATSGKCTTWTITPESDGTAALFSFSQTVRGGKTTIGPAVLVRRYVMPFLETITRK